MVLDTIFEWVVQFYDSIKPYWVVEQYNKGVLLRFGKFVKVLEPGIHPKWPFIDSALEESVVPTTMRLYCQSLVTKDEKNIVVQAIIKYKVTDIQMFLLGVNDAVDAISDMTQAIIKNIIMESTWEQCKDTGLDNKITIKARVEAKKWGIEIMQVTLSDIAQIWSVRLFNEGFLR